MSRVYPDWVGPTTEYRQASRFPRWIHVIGGLLPPTIPEGWLGGIRILPNLMSAEVQPSGFSVTVSRMAKAVIASIPGLGVIMTGQPDVEVKDEDIGV